MILTNEITVNASPDEVFALINDMERVVTCLPGAALDGRDGDSFRGGVRVKVGPVTASYAGTVRLLEVDPDRRHLRLQGRGADTRGGGDAEAEVALTVEEAPGGAVLRVRTDLLIRGKIVQFGKSAIVAVSDQLLRRFAENLAALIEADRTGVRKPAAAVVPAQEPAGLSALVPPGVSRYVPIAAAFALGLFHGWLIGKVRAQAKLIKELRRD